MTAGTYYILYGSSGFNYVLMPDSQVSAASGIYPRS